MTTNTYQALCDSVGAYYMTEGREYDSEGNICSWYKNYPPQSAEQREKLLILIEKQVGLTAIYLKETNDYIMRDETFSFEYVSITGERDECLYGITQKLVDEGVLSKGEVKEALCGNK